ncbi:MAG: hypothetical protein EPO01_06820 [Aquabacterium sp.]|nr:MAG: hypothetical protein EPO01_06820 [Aquabacterium sp.]
MYKLIVSLLASLLCSSAFAMGEFETKIKLIALDGYGNVRFQTKTQVPASVEAACGSHDWFTLVGDASFDYKSSTAYKAMVSMLQVATISDLTVTLWVAGCTGDNNGTHDNQAWWIRFTNPTP